MKQVILAMVGTLVIVYVVMISFSVFSTQTRKNDLENHVGRIIESALKEQYQIGDEEEIAKRLTQEIITSLGNEEATTVQIKALDLDKGIISVLVEQEFMQFNGKLRKVACEKTVIMEQKENMQEWVLVQFMVEEEIYKEYQLIKGEECPWPKLPAGCRGWQELGADSEEPLTEIGEIWEDKIYVAIFE